MDGECNIAMVTLSGLFVKWESVTIIFFYNNQVYIKKSVWQQRTVKICSIDRCGSGTNDSEWLNSVSAHPPSILHLTDYAFLVFLLWTFCFSGNDCCDQLTQANECWKRCLSLIMPLCLYQKLILQVYYVLFLMKSKTKIIAPCKFCWYYTTSVYFMQFIIFTTFLGA